MRKSLLLVIISLACSLCGKAQNSPDTPIEVNLSLGGPSITINSSSYAPSIPGINYGCLTTGRYAWLMFPVCDSSSFSLTMNAFADTSGYVIFGPFADSINIVSQLSNSTAISCRQYNRFSSSYFIQFHGKGLYYMALTLDNDTAIHYVDFYGIIPSFNSVCALCKNANNLNQNICLITLDSVTNRNKIIFDKGDTSNIAGYTFYRENSIANQFDSLTYIDRDSANFFIDMTANPNSRYWKYKMTRNDKCGTIIPLTSFRNGGTTLFLQQAQSTNNSINLAWNNSGNIVPYPGIGPFVQSFFIYRKSNGGAFQILDSVPNSATGYTDVNPLPGLNEYQVSMRESATCSIVNRTIGYSESLSNIISTTFTGLDEPVNHHFFEVYPNPASKAFTLKLNQSANCFVSIIAVDGKICFENEYSNGGEKIIDTSILAKGFYTVKVVADGKDYYRRLVIN